MAEIGLFLEGLRCAGCVNRAERALRESPGVREASVNYTSHRAWLVYDPEQTGPEALVACVEALGYTAIPYDPAALDGGPRREARHALSRVLVAAFLAGNVMLLSAALYIGSYQGLDAETRRFLRWLALALSVPAVTWCALPFWRGAWQGLRRLEITMDVPIVLGIAIAFSVGVAGTLAEADHLYMDSAAMIVFLILLGRTLESRSRARATDAVDRLSALAPATALRRTPDGFEEVPASALRVGDRVLVPAGQNIPADGRVVRGATEVDESLLTGESHPVLREPGDTVTGGSRNALGEIEIEVSAEVGAGTLARLAALLERAQASRPEIQRLADRVAAVFAPSVVAAALLTALGWQLAGAAWLETALAAAAVLIVACPCALGLATPMAVTAAVGRAAAFGVLVKSGDALEQLARVDTLLLDKTGTVSEGRFAVEEIASDGDDDALLRLAAEAEGASTHPVADALRRAAQRRGLRLRERAQRKALPGRGVEAGEGADRLLVGSRNLLRERAVRVTSALEEAGEKLAARGLSLAWVAEGDRARGVVGLADPPRPDARDAVARLQRLGQRVSLLSGDSAPAVAIAAARAGIDASEAELTPEAKVARVTQLRERGGIIAMVGDGINDAAALAAADVGVAMARGSDVTLQAADLVVRSPRLGAVPDAIALARATLRRIRENLGFALAYNALAIPLAVLGVLQPLHAAIAMSLSSLVVTGNAARLLRWRAPR
ncbi:MAG TPA: cation-translocating P-type ATPase [Myxococcota bacterium]